MKTFCFHFHTKKVFEICLLASVLALHFISILHRVPTHNFSAPPVLSFKHSNNVTNTQYVGHTNPGTPTHTHQNSIPVNCAGYIRCICFCVSLDHMGVCCSAQTKHLWMKLGVLLEEGVGFHWLLNTHT